MPNNAFLTLFVYTVLCSSLSTLLTNTFVVAQHQTKAQQAQQLGLQALRLVHEKQAYKQALQLLKKAQQLDSKNANYQYEIAYIYYLQKEYKKTIKLLKSKLKKNSSSAEFYWLLGAAYDFNDNSDKAVQVYKKGLSRFPNAGQLYLELGGLAYRDHNNDAAVQYWEQGIAQAPLFASNYYWAAKLYCHSSESVWGLLYGEMFMNLEPNTQRTIEISELLYTTYQSGIHLHETLATMVSYSERARTYILLENEYNVNLPFQVLYDLCISSKGNVVGIEAHNLANVVSLREQLTDNWYQFKANALYPNMIIDWYAHLQDKNLLVPYTYWLLQKGAKEEFNAWVANNTQEYRRFLRWFHDNPMPISQKNTFYRLQYQ